MSITLLSQRGIKNSPAHATLYEFEDIIIDTCEARLLAPSVQHAARWLDDRNLLTPTARKLVSKTSHLYQAIDNVSSKEDSSKTLILLCMVGSELEILSAIPNWRREFDIVVAYVIDAWFVNAYTKQVYEIDRLFVPVLEMVEELRTAFGIPVSLIPLGSDVLKYGSAQSTRPLDVMSFGRTPLKFHRDLSRALNRPDSQLVYYRHQHPESDKGGFPVDSNYRSRVDHELRMQFHKMMRLSKVVLAFDSLYDTDQIYASGRANDRPWKFRHSIIAFRWFEGCAAGCAILGKRPTTQLFEQVMNWPDSTVELPDDPSTWIQFSLELLQDHERLDSIRERNFCESLSRNDWRHRIRDMLGFIEQDLPSGLEQALESCQRAARANTA